jgi:hypothetical protein
VLSGISKPPAIKLKTTVGKISVTGSPTDAIFARTGAG